MVSIYKFGYVLNCNFSSLEGGLLISDTSVLILLDRRKADILLSSGNKIEQYNEAMKDKLA